MASGTAVRMEKDAGRVVVDGGDVRLSFARDKHHGVRKQDQTYTVELIVKEVDSSIDALQHLLETLLRATEALKNKRKTVKSGNVETLLSLFKTALETEPPEKGVTWSCRRGEAGAGKSELGGRGLADRARNRTTGGLFCAESLCSAQQMEARRPYFFGI